jgi:hypothetical protein
MENPILRFDTHREELTIIIGNEELIIENFLRDRTKRYHITVLTPSAQEKIIKQLIVNMKLKED